MNLTEMKNKSEEELREEINALKKQIHDTMGDVLKGKEKNIKKVRNLRKQVAQISTLLNQKA